MLYFSIWGYAKRCIKRNLMRVCNKHYQSFLGQSPSKFSWTRSNVYTIKLIWATCTTNRWKIPKNLVIMSIFCVKTSFCFRLCNILYFAILKCLMRNCIRKYKCEYIVYILQGLIYYFVPKTFVCEINIIFHFYLFKSVNYKACSEYSTLIGQFPSKFQEVLFHQSPSKFVDCIDQSYLWPFVHRQSSR